MVSIPSAPRILCSLLAVAAAGVAGAQERVRFTDITAAAGIAFRAEYGSADRPYVTDSGGAGAAWIDYDRDGHLDLALANGLPGPSDRPYEATRRALAGDPLPGSRRDDGSLPRNELFRGGSSFTAAGARAGFHDSAWANAIVAGDLDDDGFVDLLVTAIGPNVLYRNNGDGTFSRWASGLEDGRWTTGATLVDWDLDGDLDAYLANYVDFDASATATLGDGVCNYLGVEVFCGPLGLDGSRDGFFENRGDGTFVPWAESTVDPEETFGFAVLAFDCDGVPGQEIYVANDSNINLLYRRAETGIEDLSLFSGAGFSGAGRPQAGMGVSAADFDGDDDLDLLVSNFQHDYNTLYENIGDCTFLDAAMDRGLAENSYPYMAWSSLLFDVDGDGDEDAFVANGHLYPQLADRGLEAFGQRNQLYLNRLRESGEARFEEVEPAGLEAERSSRSAALGDYDDDGDLDLLVTQIDGPPALLRNDSAGVTWLRVVLRGRASSRDALGATVRVVSGGVSQRRELRAGDGYLSSNDTRMLIALPGGVAESVEIRWPAGGVTALSDVGPGTLLVDELQGVVARR